MADNAIQEYVAAFQVARDYVEAIERGTSSLGSLQSVRQEVVDSLAVIQSSNVYDAAVKGAAQDMAVSLRQAIIDFAATL